MGNAGRKGVGATLLIPVIILALVFFDAMEDADAGKGDGPGVLLTASLAITTLLSLWFLATKAPDPAKMSPRRVLLRAIGSRTMMMLFILLPMIGGLTVLVVGLVFFELDPDMDPVGWGGAIFSGFCFSVLMLLNFVMLRVIWEGSGPPAYRTVTRLLRQPTTITGVSDFKPGTYQDGKPMDQGDVHVEFMEGDTYHFYVSDKMAARIIEVLRAQMAGQPPGQPG